MIELPEHYQVFVAGEVFIDGGILTRQADARADGVCVFDDIKPGNLCPTRVGVQERGQDAHSGGFASAVGPEEAKYGSFLGGQVKPGEGAGLSVIFLKSFGQNSRSV